MRYKPSILVLATLALTCVLSRSASAFTIQAGQDWNYVPYVTAGGGRTDLSPTMPTLATQAQLETAADLIEAGWTEYVVLISETQLPGTVTVLEYEAKHWTSGTPAAVYQAGALITWDYETTDPIIDDLRWVQVVWTNYPGAHTSPFIDGQPGEFYYCTPTFEEAWHDGDTYFFSDLPYRPYHTTEAIQWHAATIAVETIADQVILHDGVYWGWTTIGNEEGGGGNAPVPEPTTLIAFVLPIILMRRLKRI